MGLDLTSVTCLSRLTQAPATVTPASMEWTGLMRCNAATTSMVMWPNPWVKRSTTQSPSTLRSQMEGTSRTPGGLVEPTFTTREFGFGCQGHLGHLHPGGRGSRIRMGMRTAQRWTHKMRVTGGWTWTAAKRTTGCLTTLSAKRLLKHEFKFELKHNLDLNLYKLKHNLYLNWSID